jgi:UDP-N-acetylmuramoylalanine--D-glutamate ligase
VDVVAVDRAPDADPGRVADAGVEVLLGTEEESVLDGVDAMVKSPGIPRESRLVAAAERRGLEIWSELELGSRLLENPLVAVTGTNGKTTTSKWLGAMLAAPVAGNVGRALCDLDGRVEADAWIVCEVSSFQLEDVHEFRPRVAVLLNLEPDHLDRHKTFDAYRAAKLRVFENQTPEDTAVVPRGFDPIPGAARRVEFAADDPLPAEPRLPGAHNRENAAAATAAARAAGAGEAAIARALRSFRGVAHRLELVRDRRGVRWVNDSKATNTAAARRALAAYDAPLHLILGGSLKGEDFAPLARELGPNVRSVHLIGEAADELARALDAAGVAYERSGDLATAVAAAAAGAEPGDVVLLSPACASYDQFEDFEHRGEEFKRLVQNLAM